MLCKLCNKQIRYNGKYWEHVTGNPRHVAMAKKHTDNKEEPPASSGSGELAGSISLEYLKIYRIACAIVSHTIEETGGKSKGESNEHCIDYAVSKIKELI